MGHVWTRNSFRGIKQMYVNLIHFVTLFIRSLLQAVLMQM